MNNDNNLVIEAKGLNKIYTGKNGKKVEALINLNLSIKKGITYGLLGPNGAGKSTFINILGGLVLKDSGEVKVCGIDIDKESKKYRKLIGIVPQELNMDPFFTPFELLKLQSGLYGVKKNNKKIYEILNKVSLIEQKNAYARNLSGGMKRRLLVAKALIHGPKVVILDEPTAGVDVELRQNLWDYIKELNKIGVTVLLTTHYLNEAQELCDYISIINKGKLVASNSKKNLLNLIDRKMIYFHLDNALKEIPRKLKKFNIKIDKNSLIINFDKKNDKFDEILNIF